VQGRWRPSAAWLGLAAFIVVGALGTNLAEIVYLYFLHDARVVLGRSLLDALFDDVARMLMYFVGLVILWRANDRRSCFLLGLGVMSQTPFPLFQWPLQVMFEFMVGPLAYLLPAFAMARLQESNIRLSPVVRWIFWIGLSLETALTFTDSLHWIRTDFFAGMQLPADVSAIIDRAGAAVYLLTSLLTAALLALGWRRSSRQEGHRFLILLAAVGIITFGNQLFAIYNSPDGIFPMWLTTSSSLCRTAGALLFAYAILKHRVIDVGFAINRTLVYGAVTFTILAAFGLAESAVNSFIPDHGAEAGSLITAIIALLLFFSFHHLHNWFEHQIERLFFHSWHVAEAALKRFVGSAGQFVSQRALCDACVDELRRYIQYAEVALFLRSDTGHFRLQAGRLAGARKTYPDDDRAFALMRTERAPIDLTGAHSALPGELAAPMLDQLGLAGFVLLGTKPDHSPFRPDEVENIGWATHQIGLDLQALRARSLDEELVSLRHQLSVTEAERDRLVSSVAVGSEVTEQSAL
jgi:hypothetical protein